MTIKSALTSLLAIPLIAQAGCARVKITSEDGSYKTFLTGPIVLISESTGTGETSPKAVVSSGLGFSNGPTGTALGLYNNATYYFRPDCSLNVWVSNKTSAKQLKKLLTPSTTVCIHTKPENSK